VPTNDVSHLLDGRLKLRHLSLLVTIAEQGSLVAAAKELHVTQPVVTRGLREAEDVLGVELFARGPRGVTLTPYGEIMVEHAHAVLSNLRNAGTQISELRRAGVRPVRVGTNLAGALSLLPRTLVVLKDAHPHLTATVEEGERDVLDVHLRRRDLDVVVGRVHHSGHESDLRHIRLYDEPVKVVARAGHPAAGRALGSVADLADLPWVMPPPGPLRDELNGLFERAGIPLPRNVIECAIIITVRAILLETDAVAPLPLLATARDEQLVVLDVPTDTVPRAMGLTYLRDPEPSPTVAEFIDLLVQVGAEIAREFGLRGISRPASRQ
jgi:DNA-binding transcriptional LysR family regulator